jgi:hypothetical protein
MYYKDHPDDSIQMSTDTDAMLICRFWDAECYQPTDTAWEQLTRQSITLAIGRYIHVDLIISTPDEPSTILMSFSAFENECWRGSLSQSERHKATRSLKLNITREEANAITLRCWNLDARNVPYNYSDSHYLMPFWSPSSIFIDDVTTDTISTGFCSQIIILILRECLHQDRHITNILQALNSRTTSPNTLYNCICASEATEIDTDTITDLFHLADIDQNRFVKFN